ncbi:MAG: DUF721 domain-containing protein [Phycisphaerae bacterium]|nr:DUF721 domain-containing protein [Phycisphaerae bacterium]
MGRIMQWDKNQLRTIWENKQIKPRAQKLGITVDRFFRRVVIPRQKRLSALAEVWQALLPQELLEHSCLENYTRGNLRVLVDSPVHYAELHMLVREGLLDQMRAECPNIPLSRIKLARGLWYHIDDEGNKIPKF